MSLVLSAKVRRNSSQNEQLWQTLNISNVLKPIVDFINLQVISIQEIKSPKVYSPPNFYHLAQGKFGRPYTSPNLTQNLSNDRLLKPLL